MFRIIQKIGLVSFLIVRVGICSGQSIPTLPVWDPSLESLLSTDWLITPVNRRRVYINLLTGKTSFFTTAS